MKNKPLYDWTTFSMWKNVKNLYKHFSFPPANFLEQQYIFNEA